MKKALVIILIALAVLGILIYMGLYHVFWPIGREDVGNGFSVEYRAIILVRGQSKMALYYRGHEICSGVSNILDRPYELSPDKHYALYINSEKVNDRYMHRYEVYDIKEKKSIIFPEPTYYPTENVRISWEDEKVTLFGDDLKLELDIPHRAMQLSSNVHLPSTVLTIDNDGNLEVDLGEEKNNANLSLFLGIIHAHDNPGIVGKGDKLRLIGIRPVGKATVDFLNRLLPGGSRVVLEFDGRPGDLDGRVLLAYVYNSDGEMINEALLKAGMAEYEEIEDLVIHREQLKKAYEDGQKLKKGK